MNKKSMPWAVPVVLRSPEGDGSGAGGSGENGGGGTGGGGDKGGEGGDKSAKSVPLDTHKAVLDKFHETANTLKATNAELEKLKGELASLKTKGSEDKGDFKQLYEQTKQEKAELQTRLDTFKKDVVNTQRFAALEAGLKAAGLKQGNENVIDFADLEKLPIETTSKGRILVHGVEEAVTDLKSKYSFAFEPKKMSNVNGGGGAGSGSSGGDGEVSVEDVLAAENASRAKPGDRALRDAYYSLHKKYVDQKVAKQTRQ